MRRSESMKGWNPIQLEGRVKMFSFTLFPIRCAYQNAAEDQLYRRECFWECCLKWLHRVFFDRARSGPEHGACSKNIAEQNKCGGSIRSHDSYHKRCVKNISASWTLGLWEFVGLLRLKKANITPAARSVASRRPQNNENNGGIVKKRLQNLFSENRITKTAARKKNNLQNGL